jgi:hypothetical protein
MAADVDPSNRRAYLEEQIERQKRGEPIDVNWVRDELIRVRHEQMSRMAATQKHLRWVVAIAAALLIVLWIRQGGGFDTSGIIVIGLVAIGVFTLIAVRKQRK